MKLKIFGYAWEDIKRAQQRSVLAKPLLGISPDQQAERIMRDVERFKIPVAKETKDSLGLALPDGYVLKGDTWEWKVDSMAL